MMDALPNKQADLALYEQQTISYQKFNIRIVSFHKMLCQTNLQFCMIAGKKVCMCSLAESIMQ